MCSLFFFFSPALLFPSSLSLSLSRFSSRGARQLLQPAWRAPRLPPPSPAAPAPLFYRTSTSPLGEKTAAPP